jgi:hypothetical protein
VRAQREAHALRGEQPLDAAPDARPIRPDGVPLALQLTVRFRLHRWHVDFTPAAAIAGGRIHQLGDQRGRIDPIALDAAPTPVDRDAGRIDHHVVNTRTHQRAMHPEAVPACFITTAHGRVAAQTEAQFRPFDFSPQRR